MADVWINEEGFAALGLQIRHSLMEPWADDVKSDAKRIVPVDTGRLRESIQSRATSNFSAEVYSDLDYAASVEKGSRAHLIPHAFGRPGAVMHPGGPAQPYLRPAAYTPRYGHV